jgi:hypothetical protein
MTDYTKKFGHTLEYMKKMTPNYSMKCMCPACGLFFKSSAGFDKHRVGKHDPDERRCLTIEEMKGIGMDTNKSGHWVTELMDSEALERAVGKTSSDSST